MADQRVGIQITATDKTQAAFKTVDAGLGKLSLGINKVAGLAGLLAGAAGGGFASLAKSAIEYGDNIAKVADKIGLTTDSLQELRFASERSGVSQDSLDMAMQRFSRRVGEAANGTGELTKTLDQYGIKVRDSEGGMRKLEDILSDYADTIQGAESDQEKLRLAFKAFDSEGAALVNMLKNGAHGLEELSQAAWDSDAVISEGLLRTAERMNDRWETLTNTLNVSFKTTLLEVADLIESVFFDTPRQSALKEQIDTVTKTISYLTYNLNELKSQGATAEIITEKSEYIEKYIQYLQELNNELYGIKEQAPVLIPTIQIKGQKPEKEKSVPDEDAHVKNYEDYLQFLHKRVEALRVSLLTETELENERYITQSDILINAKEKELITKEEYFQIERDLTQSHMDELNAIQEKALSREHRMWESSWQGKLAITSSILGGLSQLINSESRKQFEIGKAAATAQAVVDTISSAQGAYNAMVSIPYVGPALAAAAAAAALAAGYARVQAIQSTQFGASSSGAAGGSSASSYSSAPTAPTEPPITADTEKSTLTVQFLGDVYGMDDFQDTVIQTIRDAVTDRDEIIIRSDSRQAVELK